MSATELKTLAKLSKSGWKKLANADQSDADEVLAILREVLEAIDNIEESATLLELATAKQQELQQRASAEKAGSAAA